jgi:multidrug efflux pump subunit AcrB
MKDKHYISSFSVIVTFIAIAILGCAVVPLLPVKLSPSNTLPAITVSYSVPGSSARIVESNVTSKLESMLSRIEGVKHVKSTSSSSYGRINLEFDRNTDMQVARFDAAMVVRQAWSSMPQNANYPQIYVQQADDNASRPFMSYTVNADVSSSSIMTYAENNIKPALSQIPGVARVELSGATQKEWRVEYNSRQLEALGISLSTIQKAISGYYGTEFIGTAKVSDTSADWIRLAISQTNDVDTLDLSKIVISNQNGYVITLDKIAKASHVDAQPTSYFRINALNSIYLNITAADNANQLDLSKTVKDKLASMNLPEGYQLNLNYDASERISTELDKIYFRTGLTVLILLVFIILITLSVRYTLLVTISLALNMAVAMLAYYFCGIEIQLYSLAGITISLNLVIDNIIVMTEHIMRRHNLHAFSAVLAATLTTLGALSVVFFLDERTMLMLKDFVLVVIINLIVSLFVALFLVPALMQHMRLKPRKLSAKATRKRLQIRMMRLYAATVKLACRYRAITYLIFILAFGLPIFMLPEKIDSENVPAKVYNATFGSDFYKTSIKPIADKVLGGTLRLFVEKVYEGSYFNRNNDEPVVYINATLPNGATLEQMNVLMSKMENYLLTAEGVRQFQTSIYNARRGNISVYFKPEYQRTGYPYTLKSNAISKALTLGGGSWSIFGLEDHGFNNDVRESAGSYRIKLRGYNYDQLYKYASQLHDSLLNHNRIKEVNINSEISYWKDDYTEFYLELDKNRLAKDSLSVNELYTAITQEIGSDISSASIVGKDGSEAIKLSSDQHNRDVWGLINMPVKIGKRYTKLSDYATIEQHQTPQNIIKEDQEYVLYLQYEYIGSTSQGEKVQQRMVNSFKDVLPLGYKVDVEKYSWNSDDNSGQYWLLALVVVIIFFISSILFNSLKQPLAIIFVIPVSFIGVFLTFYLFELKFDQGGFAAFILLCGITVNAAIYIINEYNSLRRKNPGITNRTLYFRAFRAKITSIMLTVLSTVLGFIPFVVGDTQESFWFPLASGTMGGLIMSLLAILILLPTLILPRPPRHRRRRLAMGGI